MATKSKGLENFIEKLLLGLLVLALPLSELTRINFKEIAITLLDIGVVTSVFLWLFLKRKFPRSNFSRPILIFAAILFISLAVNLLRLKSNEFFASSLYLIRWIFYALLYFVVLDLSSIKKKIGNAMTIGGAVIVLLGFVQYFFYPDLRNLFYAGWDEHLYRMFTWTFFDPNFAGSFFVLYFLFLSNKLNFKNKKTIILPLITLVAIFLTFSRSAYIMLAVGIFVQSLFLKQKKAAFIFLLLIIGSIFILSKISFKSEGTNLLRTASGEARIDSIKNAITIFKDHPIFGVGFNSYRYAQRKYGFLYERKMTVHSGAGTDNSFLFVLATSGIVGFTGFLYLLLKILSIKDSLVLSSIFALVINSLFINSLFYPPIMLWMWTLIAVRSRNI